MSSGRVFITSSSQIVSTIRATSRKKHIDETSEILDFGDPLMVDLYLKANSAEHFNELVSRYSRSNMDIKPDMSAFYDEIIFNVEPEKPSKIIKPPGHTLVTLLKNIVTTKNYERVLEQTVADGREEYYAALAAGNTKEARLISRDMNISIVRICIEWVLGWPAAVIAALRGKMLGKGE